MCEVCNRKTRKIEKAENSVKNCRLLSAMKTFRRWPIEADESKTDESKADKTAKNCLFQEPQNSSSMCLKVSDVVRRATSKYANPFVQIFFRRNAPQRRMGQTSRARPADNETMEANKTIVPSGCKRR